MRQAFNDGGLAHAGFAEQHGVVLGAPAKNLHHPLDLVFAADHRIHLALTRDLREVAAKGAQRRSLVAFLAATLGRGGLAFFILHLLIAHGKVGIEFLQNFLSCVLYINIEILQHASSYPVAFAQQPQQNMFGAHVGVLQLFGFL